MSTRANKLVSLGLVTAAVAYGCYPYVSGAGPGGAGNARLPHLTPAMLSPKVPPVGAQDPFRIVHLTKKVAPAATPPTRAVVKAAKTAFDPSGALSGLTLQSTFLLGSKRLAMIDGHVYAEGAKLTQGKIHAGDLVVTRVEMDRVVLRSEGHELNLRYSGQRTAPHANTRSEAKTAKRAAPGKKIKEEKP